MIRGGGLASAAAGDCRPMLTQLPKPGPTLLQPQPPLQVQPQPLMRVAVGWPSAVSTLAWLALPLRAARAEIWLLH